MSPRALVLGGGVSGLAAAHRLLQAGWRVELIEASERLGGRLATHTEAGLPWELGAYTVASSPELIEFARAAGVEEELVPVSTVVRRRYVVHDGRLVPIPVQPLAWLSTPLVSRGAGLRLVAGRLGRWPPRVRPDERLAPALRRRLGDAGGALLAACIATGVYAGDEHEIQAAEALTSSGRRHLLRPRRGWQAWLDQAGEEVSTLFGTRAISVRRADESFEVEAVAPDGPRRLIAQKLVVALPAAATAAVLEPLGDSGLFAAIPHAPVATVLLVCRRDQMEPLPDGFGLLDPFDATGGVLGCIFASSVTPEIAPPGTHVLTVLMGGRRHEDLVDADDATLVARAGRALAELLGLRGEPQAAVVHRWHAGIPQPTAEALAARQAAAAMEARHPGLHILGDWRHGVGVPACVAAAWALATD